MIAVSDQSSKDLQRNPVFDLRNNSGNPRLTASPTPNRYSTFPTSELNATASLPSSKSSVHSVRTSTYSPFTMSASRSSACTVVAANLRKQTELYIRLQRMVFCWLETGADFIVG